MLNSDTSRYILPCKAWDQHKQICIFAVWSDKFAKFSKKNLWCSVYSFQCVVCSVHVQIQGYLQVLLSALVKRFGVSRMRYFFKEGKQFAYLIQLRILYKLGWLTCLGDFVYLEDIYCFGNFKTFWGLSQTDWLTDWCQWGMAFWQFDCILFYCGNARGTKYWCFYPHRSRDLVSPLCLFLKRKKQFAYLIQFRVL